MENRIFGVGSVDEMTLDDYKAVYEAIVSLGFPHPLSDFIYFEHILQKRDNFPGILQSGHLILHKVTSFRAYWISLNASNLSR